MSLRETLLAKAGRKYYQAEVCGEAYWFQSLTQAEAHRVTFSGIDPKSGNYIPDKFVDMQATQIMYCLVESEGGDRVFSDGDLEAIKAMDSRVFKPLYDACEKKFGKGVDVDNVVGESDSEQSSDLLVESA